MSDYEPLTGFDREIWQEELEDFVPEKVFDAHAHLWNDRFAPGGKSAVAEVDFDALDRWSKAVFPGRELGYLLLGYPMAGLDCDGFHRFMAAEIAKSPHKLGSTVVTPEISPEKLDGLIRRCRFTGLKPYRSFAPDPANCRITDYFPEGQIAVADEHRLCVTMHMAKFDGAADPENLADLAYLTRRYPHVRWILAHCARAFNPFTLEQTVFKLREMPNIWYDLSAVCDARSFYLLFKHEDRSRLLFGTDNICAGGVHGKYITWGKGWQFFRSTAQPHCRPDAALVCYESLRAIRQAADMAGLTAGEIENIFWGNAKNFFGF